MAEVMVHQLSTNEKVKVVTNLMRFWTSFKQWYEVELPGSELLEDKFIMYNNFDYGKCYLDIDFTHYYKLNLGIEYEDILSKKEVTIKEIKQLIELTYDEFVKDRYKFTIEVNKRFNKFNLPYSLEKGKLISIGYKTTNEINKIYNYEQLERKIKYSEELILSEDLLDKKTALDYITDSLQFIVSINQGDGIKKKNESVSLNVGKSKNSKVYTVIKNELDEVGKIVNEYFDIRHNEYLNKSKERREVLNDKAFIEYLYNRIYALLYIVRLNCDKESKNISM